MGCKEYQAQINRLERTVEELENALIQTRKLYQNELIKRKNRPTKKSYSSLAIKYNNNSNSSKNRHLNFTSLLPPNGGKRSSKRRKRYTCRRHK